LCACVASGAHAQIDELPTSLPRAALSAHKATAHAPAELDAADLAAGSSAPRAPT
jgi:hypothetical protein